MQGRGWMEPSERALSKELVTGLAAHYGIDATDTDPLLALRVDDVAVHYLLVLRLEEILSRARGRGEEDGDDPKKETTLVESVLRTRERLRKTMKELDEVLSRVGSGAGQGLADIMKPIMKQAEGVLEKVRLEEQRRAKMGVQETDDPCFDVVSSEP
jgi:hypothetical protein